MKLNRNEFKVLSTLGLTPNSLTQRELADATDISLGSVNAAVLSCIEKGLLADNKVTEAGFESLEPYKVDNAIIMAAGLSSRFAPVSYEKPKGVLTVRGDVLIERQIKQLLEVGITDITVVVGYKKEYFFYLSQKYGVKIVVNPEYSSRNNHASLWLVRDELANSYICSSDDYFTENPFERYVYEAYYSARFVEGETNEWCIETGSNQRIVGVEIGGSDSWIMMGHVYFDREFSTKFAQILADEYPLYEIRDKLWEEIYLDHIKELNMVMKPYANGIIYEFDSLDDVRKFDPLFIQNVDTDIFDNIVSILGCEKDEITNFFPLKQGLTNLSCHFSVGDKEYVYRHPGVGTENLVDRKSEKAGLELASKLGIDTTYIYENADEGWKISRFIPYASNLDPNNDTHLRSAMKICRELHASDAVLDRKFDFVEEGLNYEAHLKEYGDIDIPGYFELRDKIMRLKSYADADGFRQCLSHNDFFMLNFLVDENEHIDLIDWEYAGMSDEANDYGTFVVCCELDKETADKALEYYFDRPYTFEEKRHFYAYIIFAGWCWYIWSLVKIAEGENVDEWLYLYYKYAADNIDEVLGWYED